MLYFHKNLLNYFFLERKKNQLKKRFRYSDESIQILERWLQSNKDNPYASASTKRELAIASNLSVKQVSHWIRLSRSRKRINKDYKNFNSEDKVFLKDYFNNKNKNPDKNQIRQISTIMRKPESKISRWFINQRYLKSVNGNDNSKTLDVKLS